uniref:Uncharacterized protein n=1 Tax=Sinocyclocheilus anshuiensis TaxID=1608454 RepID=A0A671SU19_9TELE
MSSLPPLQHIMQPGQISIMTRLARSRTASLTSAGSVDGSRNRACTDICSSPSQF